MNHKELILSILREQKIKLWLPPYHTSTPCQDALRSLSSSISSKILMRKHDDASNVIKLDTEAIYNLLIELQTPAVEKYIQKHSVDFKIVGIASSKDVKIPSDMSSRWGDKVSIHKNGKLMIRVVNISSTLTVEMLLDDFSTVFDGWVRMICRGKNLATGCMRTIIGSDACAKKEVLCLVSPGTGPTGKRSSAAAAFSNVAPIDDVEREVPRTDATIIASVRQAAQTLEKSTTSRFEITDQSGRLVPMSQMDSSFFLTALGLHRLGRSKMEIKSTTIERTEQDASVSKERHCFGVNFSPRSGCRMELVSCSFIMEGQS
jgi:predicted regulator of Ras-like GTPase activity (Roadblock/LC7/MglB family)